MKRMKIELNRHVTVGCLMIIMILLSSCHFWHTITTEEPKIDAAEEAAKMVTKITLSRTNISMQVGSMEYISVTVRPDNVQSDVNLNWYYDQEIIALENGSSYGTVVKGIKEGETILRCICGGKEAACKIVVSGYADGYEETVEPYIYSNTSVIQTSPGITEKVYVSLYGGNAGDIDGYSWSVDNNSICTIQPTGQYCMITAKDTGYTRIKVTHEKALYPYYMGIYVFSDATNVCYITTSSNVLTMNKEDSAQSISVSLVNGKDSSKDSQFTWEILTDDNADIPVQLEKVSNTAVVTPLKSGSCTIRVTHPDAAYPMDILCRVIAVVKNVYIEPSTTLLNISDETEHNVDCVLKNIKEGAYSVDEYTYQLDDYNVAEIIGFAGGTVSLKAKANGSAKLLISHPAAAYTREVLLVITGQKTNAIDASNYITTSQNYIRTKVGAESTQLNVSLKGGTSGDESSFVWTVKSIPSDENCTEDVIKLETANGTPLHTRSAMTYAYGTAVITPKNEGLAIITISHPKIVYTTEVMVKVLPQSANLQSSLYFGGSSIIRLVNGNQYTYTAELKGANKIESDDENIVYELSDSRFKMSSSGNSAVITAPTQGTGETVSYLTLKHEKADINKKVLILTADEEETLYKMKALYTDKQYYNIEVDDMTSLLVETVGFEGTYDEETDTYTDYDFSQIQWTVANSSILNIKKSSENPKACIIRGLKSGKTTVTASLEDKSIDFDVIVYPRGSLNVEETEVYFTTTQNVVSLSTIGKTFKVNINAVNMQENEYSNIEWGSSDESVATVVGNGTNGTITAIKEGECVVTCSHPQSQNTLKIYVRVGSEYVLDYTSSTVYISATDVVTMLADSSPQTIQAVLVNYDGPDTAGFTFMIDNESVATISAQSANGICYVKPVAAGQAEVTISNPKTDIVKKVLVVVGNSEEDLAGMVYLTTQQNVVAIGEGNTKTVNVTVKNSPEVIIDGYNWVSSNPAIVEVTPNGASAVLKGNGIGTAMITVTNTACAYSLSIIAQCVDPIAAAANPYIQLSSSVLTLNVGSNYQNIVADLVGGSESDFSDFVWQSNDVGVCAVYGQNQIGKAKAMKEGTTYITVSHPKAIYSGQILVVCEKQTQSECVISVPSSIIAMKPTDSAQTITATLVNGSSTDKYNFNWSLDVYDVIDFAYSANVATVTPKQSGSVTITISHPKAQYDQKVIVNVQEYSSFSFPDTNTTFNQGTTNFYDMQVPTTKITTHIEYSSENENICTISGTKSVAQLTGVGAGTTTVHAKLVASSTGVVQASTDMLVYVKEKASDQTYITSTKTILTLNKGKSNTLSANLTGSNVNATDKNELKWASSDSDIIQIAGLSNEGTVVGSQIYITALTPGEAIITCTHEKAASALQFYVVVPGTSAKTLSLSKTYLNIIKGSSGSTIKCTISNAESSNDYQNLEWSIVSSTDEEIARIMGNGQQVTVYPLAVGEATLQVAHPDCEKVATCTVKVEANKSFTFSNSGTKVMPFHSKIIDYKVSPPNAIKEWTCTDMNESFTYTDMGVDEDGNGKLKIEGINEGSGRLICVTDGGAKGTLTIQCSWDYALNVQTSRISGAPGKKYVIPYSVNPEDAEISVTTGDDDLYDINITQAAIEITPVKETPKSMNCKDVIYVNAVNPNSSNPSNYQFAQKKIDVSFTVKELDVDWTLNYVKAGLGGSDVNHNRVYLDDAKTLHLEDGAYVELQLNIENSEMLDNVEYVVSYPNKPSAVTADASNNRIHLYSSDVTETGYLITEGYSPTYGGSRYYPGSTTLISPYDFARYYEFTWKDNGGLDQSTDTYGYDPAVGKTFWRVVDATFAWRNTVTNTFVNAWKPNEHLTNKGYARYRTDGIGSKQITTNHDLTDTKCVGVSSWGKVRDTSLDGKWVEKNTFESIPWYFQDLIYHHFGMVKYLDDDTHKSVHNVYIKQIASQTGNVKAQGPIVCPLLTESKINQFNVTVKIYHGGKAQEISIPVQFETRKCQVTLNKNK